MAMGKVPGPRAIDVFDLKLRGSFGRYKTDSSHALHYLSSTLRIDQVAGLKVAAEVFDIASLDFAELIQRDVDHSRVLKIADEYLQEGDKRVIFFPPLLICLAVMDEGDRLKSKYSDVDRRDIQDETLRTTYDVDGFQVDLYQADPSQSSRIIDWKGQNVHFFDYAAQLAINTQRAKLIVLDGQHRLRALTHLHRKPETRQVVANIEQPVCIVWMPQATQESEEEIIKDLREIFVTVNNEPRRVSGHFILLLDDNSNAASAVRSLANYWKQLEHGQDGWSRLHLLEWNTRENQSTDQRQRPFSITTVSIIAGVLESYLFNAPRMAAFMLRMPDVADEIEALDAEFNANGLRNTPPPLRVRKIVEAQIDRHLTPALDHLLRNLRPYRDIESRLARSLQKMTESAGKGVAGSIGLQAYLDRYVYTDNEIFEDFAKAAWSAFKNETQIPYSDAIFARAAFQQGYIRFWLTLQRDLMPSQVDALTAARAAVKATDAFAANPESQYLADDQPYTRRVLWKNENINFSTAWARDAWADIQVAALLRDDVRAAVIEELGDMDEPTAERVVQRLRQTGLQAAQDYTAVLKQEILKDVKRNLGDFFGEAQAGNLKEIRQTQPDVFDEEVGKMANERFEVALFRLANMLKSEAIDLRPVE
ncbi:hypothetical protein XB05_14630 [Xanthomonas arboricola]|uniref:DNA sulfur modification protein DndB n=1 Tax=Xanthomonas arboricola TaxID=56448 RepID=UPI00061A19D1|nr:DNA sulfur modification protein DndB [Xanthomonas arboricola]AKC79857.1 hypothetical protein XB05_14630 [Xanthomonas arboricola]